ncbi:MAG: TonB-dependent receptor [Acidobacteria bacterium]|nr:TonB-dependent receptor [Acidobacteriota bacterium]
MNISKNCALLLLIFACMAGAARAATLEGTVLDPSGKPVPGARVNLLRSLVAIDERQTDSGGVYKFDGLEDGTYQVTASAHSLSGPTMNVEIRKAVNQRQDIKLALSALTSQVVVSASLGGALVPQLGSSVSFVNRREIEDRGAQNALEILRGTPGTEIVQTARRGSFARVFIRGGESNYNAVLIDGIPMNQFGGEFNLASLPSDGIERIEVTRGPESALYGSNAMMGVINLISRKGEGRPQFTGLAEGGSYDTRRFAVGGSGLTRGLSWSFNLSRLDSDGAVTNDDYRNQSAFLSLGYRHSKRQISFNFFGNADDVGDPGPYGSDPLGLFSGVTLNNRVKQNLFGYQFNYSEQISSRVRQVTSVSLATNEYRYLWESYGYSGVSILENLRGTANTRSEINLSHRDTLAVGFEFSREQTKDNFYLTDSAGSSFLLPRTSLAFFAENRWSPTDRLNLITGIRMDNLRTHSLPPNASGSRPFIPDSSVVKMNPRVSATYIAREGDPGSGFGMTRLHGSFGTGIRPPSGYELGNTNNPDLKPEKSLSIDAGVEQTIFSSRAAFDVTYFHNRFKDLIVGLGGSLSHLSSFSSANLSNSRTQGLEVSFRAHPIASLELGGQYTYMDSEILAIDGTSLVKAPFQIGQRLLRRPIHSVGYNVTWRYGRLMLNTNAYIRGDVLDVEPNWGTFACDLGMDCLFENQGYVRANAGFSYRLLNGVEVYGRLNNFLNQKFEEAFGYPSLRLNFMAGMRFTLPAE